MQKTTANTITAALDSINAAYQLNVDTTGNRTVNCFELTNLTGPQLVQIMNFLAPGGVPMAGVEISMETGGAGLYLS